ncbi:hypothetical protein ABEF95_008785 [Exophiala dermatitidis]
MASLTTDSVTTSSDSSSISLGGRGEKEDALNPFDAIVPQLWDANEYSPGSAILMESSTSQKVISLQLGSHLGSSAACVFVATSDAISSNNPIVVKIFDPRHARNLRSQYGLEPFCEEAAREFKEFIRAGDFARLQNRLSQPLADILPPSVLPKDRYPIMPHRPWLFWDVFEDAMQDPEVCDILVSHEAIPRHPRRVDREAFIWIKATHMFRHEAQMFTCYHEGLEPGSAQAPQLLDRLHTTPAFLRDLPETESHTNSLQTPEIHAVVMTYNQGYTLAKVVESVFHRAHSEPTAEHAAVLEVLPKTPEAAQQLLRSAQSLLCQPMQNGLQFCDLREENIMLGMLDSDRDINDENGQARPLPGLYFSWIDMGSFQLLSTKAELCPTTSTCPFSIETYLARFPRNADTYSESVLFQSVALTILKGGLNTQIKDSFRLRRYNHYVDGYDPATLFEDTVKWRVIMESACLPSLMPGPGPGPALPAAILQRVIEIVRGVISQETATDRSRLSHARAVMKLFRILSASPGCPDGQEKETENAEKAAAERFISLLDTVVEQYPPVREGEDNKSENKAGSTTSTERFVRVWDSDKGAYNTIRPGDDGWDDDDAIDWTCEKTAVDPPTVEQIHRVLCSRPDLNIFGKFWFTEEIMGLNLDSVLSELQVRMDRVRNVDIDMEAIRLRLARACL